jgi:NAD(P)-dependent dehydrogenase (short-subunit alcohol dehydrogenase family)
MRADRYSNVVPVAKQRYDLEVFARALLPMMLDQRSAVIIHITSIQLVMPLPEATIAYAAAKAALANYSKGLSKEVSPKGVRVVQVSPGWVETEAAVGLVNELAVSKGTDYDGARQALMDSLGGITIGLPGPTEGSSGSHCLPCLAARRFDPQHGIRHRRRHCAHRVTPRRALWSGSAEQR